MYYLLNQKYAENYFKDFFDLNQLNFTEWLAVNFENQSVST